MLYAFHEMQKSLGAPMRFMAEMGMNWAQSDGNPWKDLPPNDFLAASSELTIRLTKEYPKLPFGIHTISVDGHTHAIEETVVAEKPFCQLRRFSKVGAKGEPRIRDIIPASGVSVEELMAVAVAVEGLSDHPLAQAIARDGRERVGDHPIPNAESLRSMTGRGVSAFVGTEEVLIGKAEMFGEGLTQALSDEMSAAIETLRAAGQTSMVVRRGIRDLGAIGLMDTPRESARDAIEHLRRIGIQRMVMISGDHQRVAQAVAEQVGIEEAWGDLMPEDKVDAIRKFKAEAQVAMVGDGVNDAPAMATATVGIAMGAAGSDVALETADVVLMADDLMKLPYAIALGRQATRVVKQNLAFALSVIVILILSTFVGVIGLPLGVIGHEGSTVIVVLNGLRLLNYKPKLHAPANAAGAPAQPVARHA